MGHSESPEQPRLSSSHDESEGAQRIRRLERVLGYVYALGEVIGEDILSRVEELDDQKGNLTVNWKVDPEEWEMRCFDKAWGNGRIGDGCNNVEHRLSR